MLRSISCASRFASLRSCCAAPSPSYAACAAALNPSLSEPHLHWGVLLGIRGELDRGLEELKRAEQLEPLLTVAERRAGSLLYFARRYDEAIEQVTESLALDDRPGIAHALLGRIYLHTGRYDLALAEFAKIRGPTPAAQLNAEVINNPARELDIIVVTARKRAERSQDVPISIITLNGKELQRSHSYLPTEIVQSIPNMQLQFVNPRQTAFSIRGLGSNPASEGLQTSVGLYLDGVYISRPGMLTSDLYDIEQLTVLRGPQGTLFGRNTTAGAFNITTRKSERTFSSDVEFSTGNFGLTQTRGSVTGPLSSTLCARVSAFYTGRDGTIENIRTGLALNNQNKVGTR